VLREQNFFDRGAPGVDTTGLPRGGSGVADDAQRTLGVGVALVFILIAAHLSQLDISLGESDNAQDGAGPQGTVGM